MAQFEAFSPKIEVNGDTILSIVTGMDIFKQKAFEILSRNGIEYPKHGFWYSQQACLNALKIIFERLGPNTLFVIGKKLPYSIQWPPLVNNIEKALASIDAAYHMNHRLDGQILYNQQTGVMKEGIGHYGFVKKSECSAIMNCNNPYPCDFDRGIIEGIARKFKTADVTDVSVKHDDTKPCRNRGYESCSYLVEW